MCDFNEEKHILSGVIKWFDAARGFGFLAVGEDGTDVLLHANVLRNFGQSSVAEGSKVEVLAQQTARGMQAVEVISIEPPSATGLTPPIADLSDTKGEDLLRLPIQPARVKWFDKAKGFGFANIFGQKGDVFLHVEVLRHCGFSDLAVGEAIALRVVDGRRGLMAAQVLAWDRISEDERGGKAGGAPLLLKPRLVAGAL